MTTPRLVMMIPLRRCGSNAIRLRLNMNPAFYSPYPLHLCDILSIAKSPRDLSDDEHYFRLIVDVIGLQTMSLIRWPGIVFDPVKVFMALRHLPRSIHQVYGHLLREMGAQRGATVVMDKSQDSAQYYEEYIRLFPDILFLDVVRDPRGQISSMNRAIIYDFDTLLNTNRWIEARKTADEIRERYPDKILTVRYEDFILSEETVLHRICNFLHIPFDARMMEIKASQEAQQMSALSPLWETNASLPARSVIHKFRLYLSPEEIEAIETLTLPWMKRLHYTTVTPHIHAFPYTEETAHRRHEDRKKEAWEALHQSHIQDYILRKKRAWYIESTDW